jgi:hypothetical protein
VTMNPKLILVAIAIVAAFGIATTVGSAIVTPVLAQDNMTMGGNMTGGNMTGGAMGGNMTGGP